MKLDLLITNVNLAKFDDLDLGIKENTSIGFKDGKIACINETFEANKVLDAEGQWLLPSFIDSHTHIVYGGNRANEFNMRLQGKSYEDIARAGGGIRSTVAATRQATESELYEQAKSRVEMLINEGVAVIEIKSGYGLNLETELKMLRVAKKLEDTLPVTIKKTFLGAHCLPSEFESHKDYIAYLCDFVLPKIHDEGLVDFVDGFCESIAFSAEQLKPLFEKANELNIPIKLHSEQLNNIGGTQLATEFHATSLEHLEYANESDVKAMAKANSIAVLLPGAFYFLNETQAPPLHLFRQHNVPIAIATDSNPGSSPTTSLLLMMNMASVLLKLTPTEALRGTTINAAKALRLEQCHGTLSIGKSAHCNLWTINHPFDLVYNIGYSPKHTKIWSLLS